MESLIDERDENDAFADIQDFANRLDSKVINKRQLENLIRAGALDKIAPNRRQLHEGVEMIVKQAGAVQQEKNSDQIGLFGAVESGAPLSIVPPVGVALEDGDKCNGTLVCDISDLPYGCVIALGELALIIVANSSSLSALSTSVYPAALITASGA